MARYAQAEGPLPVVFIIRKTNAEDCDAAEAIKYNDEEVYISEGERFFVDVLLAEL